MFNPVSDTNFSAQTVVRAREGLAESCHINGQLRERARGQPIVESFHITRELRPRARAANERLLRLRRAGAFVNAAFGRARRAICNQGTDRLALRLAGI